MRMRKTEYGEETGTRNQAWEEVSSVTCWEGNDNSTECRVVHGVRDGSEGHREQNTVEVQGMRSNRHVGFNGVNITDFYFRDGESVIIAEDNDMACYVEDTDYLECGRPSDIKTFAGNY